MKELYTNRTLLKPWNLDYAEDLFEYAKDPDVGPMAGWKPHEDLEESRKIIKMFMEEDDTWAVIQKETGHVIGSVGLHRDPARNFPKEEVRMLGYVLGKDYWGQGLMPEVCREVIRFAFEELGLKVLSICHYTYNLQSKRVIEKLGFHYEGTLRKAGRLFNGREYDSSYYSITSEEYFSAK